MHAARRERWIVSLVVLLAAGVPAQERDAGGDNAAVAARKPVATQPAEPNALTRDYFSANGLLNRGLYELAAAEYRKFLAAAPQHPKAAVARYGLAVALYREGKLAEALTELKQLAEAPAGAAFPFAPEVAALRAQCELAAGDYAAAGATCGRFLAQHADHALAPDVAALEVEALYHGSQHGVAARQTRVFLNRWPDAPQRERVLLLGGAALATQKEWAAAGELLAQLLEAFPQTTARDQAAWLLAQSCVARALDDEAERWFRAVLEVKDSPHVPDALLGLAATLHRQGKREAAGALLDRLLADFASSALGPQALLLRGRLLFEEQDYAAAAATFEKLAAAGAEPGDAGAYWRAKCALRLERYDDAATQLGRAIEAYPKSALRPEMLYDRAVALVQQGNDDAAAVAALAQFLREQPQHALAADALHTLAVVEHRAKEYDKSAAHCKAFTEKHSAHAARPAVAFLAAENEFLAGRYAAAADRYRAFLEAYKDDPQARRAQFRLGMAYYRLERLEDAREPLAEAARHAGEDALLRASLLALGEIAFARSEWKGAEEWLARYLAAGRDVASADEALLKLGMAQYRQDRPADARATFTRLLDEHPDSGRALHAVFERGQALVALKQDAEAAADFARVLKEGPQSRFAAYAANHLGAIALRRGEHAAAAAQFARVLEHKPERDLAADALLQQGRALLAGGKYAEAEKALARFLEQHGAHPQAATAAAQRAIATARQDRPADALKLIEALAESKATAELAGALQSAVQYEQAWCLRKLGRNEEAAQAYRAVVDGPADAAQRTHALLELAEIEAAAGRCAAAIPLLTRLLESAAAESAGLSSELRVVAAYRLGICQFETAGFEAAAATLGDLLKKNLRDDLAASAGYFCGEARFRLGRHVDAVESFGRVAESFKDDAVWPASVLRLGECLAELQRWERSERAYADFLRAQPAHEQAYKAQFGLGWARENMGRHDEAIAAYRVVVERHPGPTAARAQFQIGECLFAKKQYDEAARELLKVDILYAYPEWSAAALFEAGRCFEQLGKAVEARRQFEAVREKHGKTRWAELAAQRLAASGGDGLPGRGTTSAAP